MFDLSAGKATHLPRGGLVPILMSSALYATLAVGTALVPLFYLTTVAPELPSMMAFVVSAPDVPPPPPPPTPVSQRRSETRVQPARTSVASMPVEVPPSIAPEPVSVGAEEGAVGAVEGGVPGGIVGGVVGGIPDVLAPPPPPPLPRPPSAPVRVGGQIRPPELLHRVDPVYPNLAVQARVQGTVILEATVDERGEVQNVKVLRSVPLLDKAALAAVRQWRYSPVILNGQTVPFTLTVVVSFTLPDET